MPRHVLGGEAEKPRSIIVEDVTLLLWAEEGSGLDAFNRGVYGFRPDHLIRAKHDTICKACIDQPLQARSLRSGYGDDLYPPSLAIRNYNLPSN